MIKKLIINKMKKMIFLNILMNTELMVLQAFALFYHINFTQAENKIIKNNKNNN